jgi:hypothetical protein
MKRTMTRGIGLLSLVVSLAAGAYLMSAQMSTHSPATQKGARVVTMAEAAAAATALEQAGSALDQTHALNGSYAGASLAGFGVTLVRADASSYCLQTASNGAFFHLAGPGGAVTPGSC